MMLHGLLCFLAGRRVPLARLDWAHARRRPMPRSTGACSAPVHPVRGCRPPWRSPSTLGCWQAAVAVDAAASLKRLPARCAAVGVPEAGGAGAALSDRVQRPVPAAPCRPGRCTRRRWRHWAGRLNLSTCDAAPPAGGRRRHLGQQLKDAVRRELAVQLPRPMPGLSGRRDRGAPGLQRCEHLLPRVPQVDRACTPGAWRSAQQAARAAG